MPQAASRIRRYIKVWGRSHPLTNPSGYAMLHRVVLYDKIGPGDHSCHWCGVIVRWGIHRLWTHPDGTMSLVADHLDSDTSNNAPDNLVPACNSCNSHRDRGIKEGEAYVINSNGRRGRGDRRNCKQCGATFTAPMREVKRGRGDFCSHKCSAAYKWDHGVLKRKVSGVQE